MADSESVPGRINKVLFVDQDGAKVGEWASQQLSEDPFDAIGKEIRDPPFDLMRLASMAELHPVHSACLDQKATDVIGGGWEWQPSTDDADDEQREALERWWNELGGDDFTTQEVLQQFVLDYETFGTAYLELVRDPRGVVRRLAHIPAHTVRVSRKPNQLLQMREGRKVFFKRWGFPGEIDARTGEKLPEGATAFAANEILTMRRMSRRSSFYGVPGYIPAIGWVTLGLAARDYNLLFFQNRREARWAIILMNIEDSEELEESIRETMRTELKEPHRNLLFPVEGDGKVIFHKLSEDNPDGAFRELLNICDEQVLVSHRIPGDRVGIVKRGPLGGSAAEATNRIYKEAVVQPAQSLLASRMNRLIAQEFRKWVEARQEDGALTKSEVEFPDVNPEDDILWNFAPTEFDITEEESDLLAATQMFTSNLATLDEARSRMRLAPADDEDTPDEERKGDKFAFELTGGEGGAAGGEAEDPFAALFAGAEKRVAKRLDDMDEVLRDLLTDGSTFSGNGTG